MNKRKFQREALPLVPLALLLLILALVAGVT